MKKFHLFVLLLLAGASIQLCAQSMVTVEREGKRVRDKGLEGKGAAVFKSRSAELVISTAIKDDPICEEPVKVQNGYEYRMEFDISNGSDSRVFNVALKGTTIVEKTKQIQLYKDEVIYFNVELVEKPITMELSPDGSQFLGAGKGWALVEFNSETPLTISSHEALKGHIRRGRSKAGIYVDSLIISVDAIKKQMEELQAVASHLEEKEKHIDDVLETVSEEEMKNLEKEKNDLVAVLEQKEDRLEEMVRISIKGDNTNERFVDPEAVKGLQSKGKLRFNIVLLTKTQTVLKTRYEELIHQAESHKKTRDYALAKSFYESAADADGASESDKQLAIQCSQKMDKLADFKAETDRRADQLYELSAANKRVNKDAFCTLIDDIAERYDALYNETGETYYKDEAERLRKQKENIGFVLKGKCVISDYKGGMQLEEPLAEVAIYGSDQPKSETMKDRGYKYMATLLGESDARGQYSITLKEGEYKTIIYVAPASAKFKKNKVVGIEGLTGDRNVKVRFSKEMDK